MHQLEAIRHSIEAEKSLQSASMASGDKALGSKAKKSSGQEASGADLMSKLKSLEEILAKLMIREKIYAFVQSNQLSITDSEFEAALNDKNCSSKALEEIFQKLQLIIELGVTEVHTQLTEERLQILKQSGRTTVYDSRSVSLENLRLLVVHHLLTKYFFREIWDTPREDGTPRNKIFYFSEFSITRSNSSWIIAPKNGEPISLLYDKLHDMTAVRKTQAANKMTAGGKKVAKVTATAWNGMMQATHRQSEVEEVKASKASSTDIAHEEDLRVESVVEQGSGSKRFTLKRLLGGSSPPPKRPSEE
jgi:hypothetical protein